MDFLALVKGQLAFALLLDTQTIETLKHIRNTPFGGVLP